MMPESLLQWLRWAVWDGCFGSGFVFMNMDVLDGVMGPLVAHPTLEHIALSSSAWHAQPSRLLG